MNSTVKEDRKILYSIHGDFKKFRESRIKRFVYLSSKTLEIHAYEGGLQKVHGKNMYFLN